MNDLINMFSIGFFRKNRRYARAILFGLICVTAPLAAQVGAFIPQKEIRAKIHRAVEQQFKNSGLRFQIEWVSDQPHWNAGKNIDSIRVSYPFERLPRGGAIFRVEAFRDGRVVRRLSYTITVRVFGKVAVSSTKMPARHLLTSADVTWAEKEITHLRGEPVTDARALENTQTRRFLRKGAVIIKDAIASIPIIARGKIITLRYQASALQIDMRVKALQDGAENEVIWFFNPDTKKRVKGRVLTPILAQVVR